MAKEIKCKQELTVRTDRQSQSTKSFSANPSQIWGFEHSILSKSAS